MCGAFVPAVVDQLHPLDALGLALFDEEGVDYRASAPLDVVDPILVDERPYLEVMLRAIEAAK